MALAWQCRGWLLAESPGLPVITLLGSLVVDVPLNSAWTDPGYTATDADGNDLTGSVTVTGTVDTTREGAYIIYYQVADARGVPATPQARTVNVVAPEPQYLEPEPGPEPQPQPQQGSEPEPLPEPQPQPEPEPTQEPESEPEQESEEEEDSGPVSLNDIAKAQQEVQNGQRSREDLEAMKNRWRCEYGITKYCD